MPLRLSINIGFITNSSSAVYHFPRHLLEDPKVKSFLEAFELHEGLLSEDLWSRSHCTTIAMTKEQKQEVKARFATDDSYPPAIDTEDDSVLVIFGDEHSSIANTLAKLLCDVGQKLGIHCLSQEYN